MKRLLALTIAVLAPTGLVFGWLLATSGSGLPVGAQARLSQYLQFQTTTSQQSYGVQRLSQAGRPWNFSSAMSDATFGDSVYYQTTHNRWAQPLAWPLVAATSGSLSRSMVGARPLPFPPSEVWCVRLSEVTSGVTAVIFVALHEDLYNADWIVHESRPAARIDDVLRDLNAVGCEVGLGQ
jgi:hypothetical protein